MDLRELIEDHEETYRAIFAGLLKSVWITMPCVVTQDSADGHTCSIQPTVKRAVTGTDGQLSYEDHPIHPDVPIHHPSGGGFTITHPIKKGDEGIVVYASRNIDSWHQSGGSQQPMDDRMHHLGDAMYIPGIRSTPRKLQNVSTSSSQVRTDDGKHLLDVHQTNGLTLSANNGDHTVTVHPENGIAHTSKVAVNINAPQGTFTIPSLSMIGNFSLGQDGSAQGGNLHLDQDITVRSITATQTISAQTVNAPNGKVGS